MEAEAKVGGGRAAFQAQIRDLKASLHSQGETAEANEASGIDGAISALNVSGDGAPDEHPEKRMKALHMAFEERMMPEMKEQYPGLRKSQYKEKIFQLWKKSAENPMNRIGA